MAFKRGFIIYSSSGELLVDRETGVVIDIELSNEADPRFGLIRSIDIMEQQKYRSNLIDPKERYDILDFGYWSLDGTYVEPAHDWRNLIKTLK